MATFIPEDIVQKLRDLPIEKVALELGIHVRRHTALCFNHDDHHPSLAFNVGKNTFRCYVCNQLYGGPISLVQKYYNLDFVDACLWLCHKFGIFIPDASEPQVKQVERKPLPKKEVKPAVEMDLEVLETLVSSLSLTEKAVHFLTKERLYSMKVVENLQICAAETDDEIIHVLTSHYPLERLQKCQLVYKKEGELVSYFHAPCLFFPYFNEEGKLISLQARYLGEKEEFPRFQFPKGAKSCVFNLPVLNDLSDGEQLFVSEGVTDCLALLSDGKKAIAIPSATSLHAVNIAKLAKHPLGMYPDNDEPGERLCQQLKTEIESQGGSFTKYELPDGTKDYSAYYVKHDDLFRRLKTVRLALAKAQNLPAFCICTDACLKEIAAKRPTTLQELSSIKGFGAKRVEKYGEAFLKEVPKGTPMGIL